MAVDAETREDIEEFARSHYEKQDQTHGIEHLERTVKLAEKIAEKEVADKEIVILGAQLHQLHDAEKVESFLQTLELEESNVEQVTECVRYSDIDNVDSTASIEAKVVYDADKLQVVGPFGVIREIACDTGERGKSFREALEHTRRIEKECFETLQTETGKEIGRDHHELLEDFWNKLEEM
ncbi:MAG: HD domain-containing protein, partial [Candidatus Nanohaloarchaea archaeon]